MSRDDARERQEWVERQTRPKLAAFLETYGVKRYKHGYLNLKALLSQAGADEPYVGGVLRKVFRADPSSLSLQNHYGDSLVFDHAELYGRDRVPLFLVGHPYNVAPDADDGPHITEDAAATIEAVRSLGMTVAVLGRAYSWYGWGTRQVVVYHMGTVRKICGDVPIYPFAEPAPYDPWPGKEASR